ncbi:hypothetical protein AK812_SmicGene29275 [Symbiodinium microadriaticum]|uniref:Uncharacterized protein n=1 Tax=Symbiodinium microadriaticum TaxID=2951 RepID=A0A1Q9D2B0_SYMMI|nr:hypothetical protein AK812_SmicGene29275 [Symbiodinium microadriaticum]
MRAMQRLTPMKHRTMFSPLFASAMAGLRTLLYWIEQGMRNVDVKVVLRLARCFRGWPFLFGYAPAPVAHSLAPWRQMKNAARRREEEEEQEDAIRVARAVWVMVVVLG